MKKRVNARGGWAGGWRRGFAHGRRVLFPATNPNPYLHQIVVGGEAKVLKELAYGAALSPQQQYTGVIQCSGCELLPGTTVVVCYCSHTNSHRQVRGHKTGYIVLPAPASTQPRLVAYRTTASQLPWRGRGPLYSWHVRWLTFSRSITTAFKCQHQASVWPTKYCF